MCGNISGTWLLTALILTACTKEGTRPADMSAAEHQRQAASHGAEARRHAAQYDPGATSTRAVPAPALEQDSLHAVPQTTYYSAETYNPTQQHRRLAETHREHAAAHARAAAALESFQQAECGSLSPEVRSTCPLLGRVVSVEDLDEPAQGPADRRLGVRVYFEEEVNMDAVIAHARCHVSFAAVEGFAGMEECPLYIRATAPGSGDATAGVRRPGIRVEPGRAPRSLDLLVADESQLEMLRRRARAHVAP